VDENDKCHQEETEPNFIKKIKNEDPSSSSYVLEGYATKTIIDDPSPIKSEKDDLWYQLETGGEIKDLLPTGMIKNSSKLRFDVKEISLSEDV
jgi:hypothetical protein